jgi:hypothetical protein
MSTKRKGSQSAKKDDVCVFKTQRYTKYHLKNAEMLRNNLVYLSFFKEGNDIPDDCWILIPYNNTKGIFKFSLKATHGYVAIDTARCPIEVSVRLDVQVPIPRR